MQNKIQDFTFTTDVLESAVENEFVVEFFPYANNAQAVSMPSRVTNNFDELIDFLEQIDDKS